jgi:hypothetical protein
MLTPRVTETHRLSPYAFAYVESDIPTGETVRDYARRTKPGPGRTRHFLLRGAR